MNALNALQPRPYSYGYEYIISIKYYYTYCYIHMVDTSVTVSVSFYWKDWLAILVSFMRVLKNTHVAQSWYMTPQIQQFKKLSEGSSEAIVSQAFVITYF